jgi:Uma2 family endonuclease
MASSVTLVPALRSTWSDFISLGDDDRRELIDGELVEVEEPTALHEWIVSRLIILLGGWAEAHRAGIVIGSGYRVKIRDDRGVMPDVQFFRFGGRKISEKGLEQGAPDLAVEVVSPGSARYDRVKKLNWYASIKVPEYWLIDPELKTLERFRLEPSGHYLIAEALSDDAVFAPETFPGLSVDLARLWAIPEGP